MSIWLYVVIAILIILLLIMIIKLYCIKKSITEIRMSFKNILKTDTNNLLTISSSDRELNRLANELNTELKNLRTLRLQYEKGNHELKKMITNISHDMRTPLTAISGYIDLMKNAKEIEKSERYLEVIERKTSDLINLTELLFDFSKSIDLGIRKEKICINELLEEVVANYYSIFKENTITPKIDICEEKIYRDIDKNAVVRAFENILSNVSKYSSGDFSLKLSDDGKIFFSNKAKTLDATTVKKIFDRYYTVENAKKSTGLGLSIAKQLIELNNGIINAKYIKGNLIIEIEF